MSESSACGLRRNRAPNLTRDAFTRHFGGRYDPGNNSLDAIRVGGAMLKCALTAACAIVVLTVLPAGAIEQPRIVPRSAHINQPIEHVFSTLQRYFSDPSLSLFHLVSAEHASGTIVATRNGIDDENWTKWAFCKTGPAEMIYQLEDGAVTVTVKLEPSGNSATFATVTADFQGTYGLGSAENKVACISTGTLEQSILSVAGATPATAGAHPSH
jgi:hypothetical protein